MSKSENNEESDASIGSDNTIQLEEASKFRAASGRPDFNVLLTISNLIEIKRLNNCLNV